MAKFVMMFRGGTVAPEKYEAHGQAWNVWFEQLGASSKLLDGGAPLAQGGKVVWANDKVTDYNWETDSNTNGLCFVESDSIDDAVELTKGCPALDSDVNGTVEVRELSNM